MARGLQKPVHCPETAGAEGVSKVTPGSECSTEAAPGNREEWFSPESALC